MTGFVADQSVTSVRANGMAFAVGSGGRFSALVSLPIGAGEVVVQADDAAGNTGEARTNVVVSSVATPPVTPVLAISASGGGSGGSGGGGCSFAPGASPWSLGPGFLAVLSLALAAARRIARGRRRQPGEVQA